MKSFEISPCREIFNNVFQPNDFIYKTNFKIICMAEMNIYFANGNISQENTIESYGIRSNCSLLEK